MSLDDNNNKIMIEQFKYYKRKDKEINLDNVIDCSEKDEDKLEKINIKTDIEIKEIGLKQLNEWKIYNLKSCPGLIIIKNPFTSIAQRYWIMKLLKDYTVNNPNNLLESRFRKEVIQDFWKSWRDEVDEQQKRLIKKSMRWTTLGFHYDWTNKIYDENNRGEFPAELHELISTIARVLGFENYKSEAAIINFYHIGTTLAAHTDHSEICNAPLFSVSFGQSAIFLIGGLQKEDEAMPILINSGDIVIMSGDSRFKYHAVPRIFASENQPWNENQNLNYSKDLNENDLNECLSREKWQVYNTYLCDSRINVNVRQFKK